MSQVDYFGILCAIYFSRCMSEGWSLLLGGVYFIMQSSALALEWSK